MQRLCTVILIILAFGAYSALAEYPPQPFTFGNHIDTHQKTWFVADHVSGDPVQLVGYFYISLTGEIDPVSGLPIARHPRGPGQHNEDCDDPAFQPNCIVGWTMRGVPGAASFLSHSGINGDDHPVWLVNRVDIPQPGQYSHFHWIGSDGDDPRASTVPAECDKDRAGDLEGNVITADKRLVAKQEDDVDGDGTKKYVWDDPAEEVHVGVGTNNGVLRSGAEGISCPGWYLEITAVKDFAFQHGGEVAPVRVGSDLATHLNLLTNYGLVPAMTPTRGGGGGH